MNKHIIFTDLSQVKFDQRTENESIVIFARIHGIQCKDFRDMFHGCCNSNDTSGECRSPCLVDMLIRANGISYKLYNISLKHDNPAVNISNQLEPKKIKVVSLTQKPALIDEWIIVTRLFGNTEKLFIRQGVHDKCILNVTLK
ncbi:hypothetical protein RF11_12643 [Thelohanellus kitauei]|uniref:Uncharacterized protein n=1 Tax=Thelohanellus kitauei TaxID=669202 RepID=A0A0C2N5H9_THEKT|nr:hypothetical protein RF11_12643 [Thelohanellus kitauei]